MMSRPLRHWGKVLAVLGASEFQAPLIKKAREFGCVVHAFAWECGDPGERLADVFHPVSTADRDAVLRICLEVGADGVCTIGSDFNNAAATWVANRMGLPANSDECALVTTDKRAMRRALAAAGDPSPASVAIREGGDVPAATAGMRYPVIVKPSDRSGSRGVTKVDGPASLGEALSAAWGASFSGTALAEEFLEGDEFSVECFSWEGRHRVLQVTRKYTTGPPRFIETGHIQPPLLSEPACGRVRDVVVRALGTLGVTQGASHAEVKVDPLGDPRIVEIASRMGGDFIGSHLVPLSAGVDYVGAVVDAALGVEPHLVPGAHRGAAAARFVLSERDARALEALREEHPDYIVDAAWERPRGRKATDSSTRFGHVVMAADTAEELLPWMPGGQG